MRFVLATTVLKPATVYTENFSNGESAAKDTYSKAYAARLQEVNHPLTRHHFLRENLRAASDG